jgi:hypothetical protein
MTPPTRRATSGRQPSGDVSNTSAMHQATGVERVTNWRSAVVLPEPAGATTKVTG